MKFDLIYSSLILQFSLFVFNWYFDLNLPWFVLWSPILLCLMFIAIIFVVFIICGVAILSSFDDINQPITNEIEEYYKKEENTNK